MTQQYLIGRLSELIGELQPPPAEPLGGAVHDLRREVERCSVRMLPQLAHRAMDLTDLICWEALERGDGAGFRRYAATAVALGDFAASAGLDSG